jgi:uncharacterized protein (TIGR01777 family)
MNKKKIIIAGGSGFLGHALSKHFSALGWEIVILTRRLGTEFTNARQVAWDGESLGEWKRELEGAEALINLSGRSVDCRYTPRNRRIIVDSRVKPTRILGEAIAGCKTPPRVWLNASSATIYRHTFDTAWDETGSDFTPTPAVQDQFSLDVIHAWEGAFNAAVTPLTRKIALRTTMVLGHARNSVFPVLCRLAKFGLGGRMGSGKQFVSWLHEEDFCRAVEWLVAHDNVSGPVNFAAPNPLPNADMMRLFRELVGMPIGLPATEWMLEIGAFFLRTETELILKSRRVIPGKLLAGGFEFRFPTMREALQNLKFDPNPNKN